MTIVVSRKVTPVDSEDQLSDVVGIDNKVYNKVIRTYAQDQANKMDNTGVSYIAYISVIVFDPSLSIHEHTGKTIGMVTITAIGSVAG